MRRRHGLYLAAVAALIASAAYAQSLWPARGVLLNDGTTLQQSSGNVVNFGNGNVLDADAGVLTLGAEGSAVVTTPTPGTGQELPVKAGDGRAWVLEMPATLDNAEERCTMASDGSVSGNCLGSVEGSVDLGWARWGDGQGEHVEALATLGYFPVVFEQTFEQPGTSYELGTLLLCSDAGSPNIGGECFNEGIGPGGDEAACGAGTGSCTDYPQIQFDTVGTYLVEMHVAFRHANTDWTTRKCAGFGLFAGYTMQDVTVSQNDNAYFGNPISELSAGTSGQRFSRSWDPTISAIVTTTAPDQQVNVYALPCGSGSDHIGGYIHKAGSTVNLRRLQ